MTGMSYFWNTSHTDVLPQAIPPTIEIHCIEIQIYWPGKWKANATFGRKNLFLSRILLTRKICDSNCIRLTTHLLPLSDTFYLLQAWFRRNYLESKESDRSQIFLTFFKVCYWTLYWSCRSNEVSLNETKFWNRNFGLTGKYFSKTAPWILSPLLVDSWFYLLLSIASVCSLLKCGNIH